MSHDPNAAGLSINWQCFGSNGHETADYSKGVLERFTRRAPTEWHFTLYSQPIGGNPHVKTIFNPRAISSAEIHNANFFKTKYSVNENGKEVPAYFSLPVTVENIAVNHYYTKSFEEFTTIKRGRKRADKVMNNAYTDKSFERYDRNEVFDDGILTYRDERAKTFQRPDKSRVAERLLNALAVNLSPTLLATTPQKFYAGKMETFLTCREVAAYLKKNFADESSAKFLEEAALKAILKSASGMSFADAQLLLSELPNLLTLPYPVVDELHAVALQIIPQVMEFFHLNRLWKDFTELDYVLRLLKTWRPQ